MITAAITTDVRTNSGSTTYNTTFIDTNFGVTTTSNRSDYADPAQTYGETTASAVDGGTKTESNQDSYSANRSYTTSSGQSFSGFGPKTGTTASTYETVAGTTRTVEQGGDPGSVWSYTKELYTTTATFEFTHHNTVTTTATSEVSKSGTSSYVESKSTWPSAISSTYQRTVTETTANVLTTQTSSFIGVSALTNTDTNLTTTEATFADFFLPLYVVTTSATPAEAGLFTSTSVTTNSFVTRLNSFTISSTAGYTFNTDGTYTYLRFESRTTTSTFLPGLGTRTGYGDAMTSSASINVSGGNNWVTKTRQLYSDGLPYTVTTEYNIGTSVSTYAALTSYSLVTETSSLGEFVFNFSTYTDTASTSFKVTDRTTSTEYIFDQSYVVEVSQASTVTFSTTKDYALGADGTWTSHVEYALQRLANSITEADARFISKYSDDAIYFFNGNTGMGISGFPSAFTGAFTAGPTYYATASSNVLALKSFWTATKSAFAFTDYETTSYTIRIEMPGNTNASGTYQTTSTSLSGTDTVTETGSTSSTFNIGIQTATTNEPYNVGELSNMTKGQVLYGSSATFSFTGPMQATIMGTSTDELTITDSTYTIAPGNIVRLKDRYIYTNATTILNDQGYVTEASTNLGTGSGLFL